MELITSECQVEEVDLSFINKLPECQRILVSLPNGKNLADVLIYAYNKRVTSIPISLSATAEQIQFYAEHGEASYRVDKSGLIKLNEGYKHSKSDVAFIMYTSGSTGTPKGILLERKAIEQNAQVLSKIHNFKNGHATCLPLYHCNALMMSLIGSYLSETTLFIQHAFDADDYFKNIKKYNIRTATIVPALLEELLASSPEWPNCLEYLIIAAAPLSQNLAGRFYKQYGPRLRQGYGLSEAVNFSFLMPQLDDNEFIQHYVNNYPPVGFILPGQKFKIDSNGEILISGETLMKGYLKDKVKTQETITVDGWLRTGDIGELRDDMLVLKGRIKEIINRGGETLYPACIEEHWENIGIKKPFAAVQISNEKLGEDIGFFIDRDGLKDLSLLNNLKPYTPSVVFCGNLKTTSTGKLQRKKMGENLFSVAENEILYASLLNLSKRHAENIVAIAEEKIVKPFSSAGYILNEARNITAKFTTNSDSNSEFKFPADLPAVQLLNILVENFPNIINRTVNGEELVRVQKGLWDRLMCEWPMKAYAEMAANFLIGNDLLSGKVLEVGAGVGNTSQLIGHRVNKNFIRTDSNTGILQRISVPGKKAFYDFNFPGQWCHLDTIFAVNAIHCASDKHKTVRYLYDMLKEGGTLLLSEGNCTTDSANTPWALNILFGLFTGWWNISGFLTREMWIQILIDTGFSCWGYSQLRSGKHDLGGLLWAVK